MKNIILITASFPYFGGEQFLENEIKYYKNIKVNILPLNKTSETFRVLSSNVILDTFIVDKKVTKIKKLFYLIKSFMSKLFYREIGINNFLSFKKLRIFFSSISLYQIYYKYFDEYFNNIDITEELLVYTYWNNEATYALQTLKHKYNYKLISRIHGYDIYKERRIELYMPLKTQFTLNIDRIYTITESANNYLVNTYGFKDNILKLSRLGVKDLNIITKPTSNNCMHIVSCSFLSKVKRIDKIINAIAILSKTNKNISYRWTHIGNGDLFDKLQDRANIVLGDINNIFYDFLGNLDNKNVYSFYENHNIDVFINSSESEGVPVSIMEAMSCHIPIVAPNVGGISDMVNSKSGILLSKECGMDEIVLALSKNYFFKDSRVRNASYSIFLEKYDANSNYNNFIESWSKI